MTRSNRNLPAPSRSITVSGNSPAGSGPNYSPDHAVSPAGPVVLIVDDDAYIREALSTLLADEGLRCVAVSNCAAAIDHLRGGVRPDLILLDMLSPVMNGWEFRAVLLADPALATIPTVVLTAADDIAARVAELGIDYILRKPLDLDLLFEAIHHFAPRWRPGK